MIERLPYELRTGAGAEREFKGSFRGDDGATLEDILLDICWQMERAY